MIFELLKHNMWLWVSVHNGSVVGKKWYTDFTQRWNVVGIKVIDFILCVYCCPTVAETVQHGSRRWRLILGVADYFKNLRRGRKLLRSYFIFRILYPYSLLLDLFCEVFLTCFNIGNAYIFYSIKSFKQSAKNNSKSSKTYPGKKISKKPLQKTSGKLQVFQTK